SARNTIVDSNRWVTRGSYAVQNMELIGRANPPDGALRRRLHRNDLERVHVAILVADRHVLAGHEGVGGEAVARLVILLRGLVIVEPPARMLVAAGLVHQLADFLVVPPEPAHATVFAVLSPQARIDMVAGVQRRDELVAVARRAVGKFLRAGEIEPNAL